MTPLREGIKRATNEIVRSMSDIHYIHHIRASVRHKISRVHTGLKITEGVNQHVYAKIGYGRIWDVVSGDFPE